MSAVNASIPSTEPIQISSFKGRLKDFSEKLKSDKYRDAQELFPGLDNLFDDWIDTNTPSDPEEFVRGAIKVLKDSPNDFTYSTLLDQYDTDEKQKIDEFVQGKVSIRDCGKAVGFKPTLGSRVGFKEMERAQRVDLLTPRVIDGHLHGPAGAFIHTETGKLITAFEEIFEPSKAEPSAGAEEVYGDTSSCHKIVAYKSAPFQNWGLTVENTPLYTFVPTTSYGVQSIVRYAIKNNLRVRASGYRHSWSPSFGQDGCIQISTLDLVQATKIPDFTALSFDNPTPSELNAITKIDDRAIARTGKQLVRVGTATTNEQLRRWSIREGMVTLPLNVIMVEITLGGSNAPICHGAGIRNRTLSDLVRRIEYINCKGEAAVLDDTQSKDWLLAGAGCFGLLGIITHLTMEMDPMTYAIMSPFQLGILQAIPPPPDMPDDEIPAPLRPAKPPTPEARAVAQAEFERRATEEYYAEWFWFPYSHFVWVNTWSNTEVKPQGVLDYPDDDSKGWQFVSTFAMQLFQDLSTKLRDQYFLAQLKTTLISSFALYALPNIQHGQQPIVTYLPDALHFKRSIQNIRVRDMEVEMPLQPRQSDPSKVDWSYVQRAWWDAIKAVYAAGSDCPMRMPLEMRVMGGSDIVMAPQRGNKLGTCSIEVLTLEAVKDKWPKFAQGVLDMWMSYRDADGQRLNTRPHWAKEWYNFTVDGKPWAHKLKNETYKDEIVTFKRLLAEIGASGKTAGQTWTLKDLKARFSNELFDYLYFDDV